MNKVALHYRRSVALIWFFAALLLLLTAWHVTSLVQDSRARELASADRDLANLTRVSQEHASRTFRSADQVIRFIRARYLDMGHQLDLTALTEQGVIDAEIFPQVGVIDERGIYILANRPVSGVLDLSDRAHFKVHLGSNNTDALFVSQPIIGRATGKWSIQLTRRIQRPNGDFAGVVVVSIDPSYFTHFYNELTLGSQGVMALYGLDAVARARKIGNIEEYGTPAPNAPMFARIAAGQLHGAYTNRSVVDGVERLYHYRKIPGYDLVVVNGLDTADLLSHHDRAKQALWQQAGLLSVLIVALAAALTRYLLLVRRELTARQQAQDQIEERNQQLNTIFELSPDGFAAFDQLKRVKYVSPAFARLTDLGGQHLEGMDEQDLSVWLAQRCLAHAPFMGVAALRAQVMGGKPDTRMLLALDTQPKRVLQVGLRCSAASSVSQILYLRDVTYETEVDQMKSEFLATAAHELRTPMASIFGYSELLMMQEFEAEDRQQFVTIIHRQSQLMASIINELLDLARIEARRGKDFNFERLPLQEVAVQTLTDYQPPEGRQRPLISGTDLMLPVKIDRKKMQQVLLNVISNAYKYSPQGGDVLVRLYAAQTEDQARACLEVQDHGIGMTPEQLSRVCERFYRADSSGKILGTGLGMSIVKEIVELLHGDIELQSQPGHGTTVKIWLPMA